MSVYFEKELLMIKNEEVRNLVIETLKNVKDKFYHAPASSSGKYHPDYALGDGGLYRHTEAAVKIAYDLLGLEWYQNLFDEITRDYIIAALILHDTCKNGAEWRDRYTLHTHPLQAASLVESVKPCKDSQEISRLISSHMGQWNEPGPWNRSDDRTILPKPEKDDEFFVHLCDYLASRRFLEVKDIS